MSPRSAAIPALRLVNASDARVQPPLPSGDSVARARRQIAAENHSASNLSADDARWAFAVTVSQSLQGGRTAALPPAARERLLGTAGRMGLRPFDANLVIAIVQDGARSGEGALAAPVAGRLMLVRPPGAQERPSIWPRLALAAALAAVMCAAMIRWVEPG
jgi:hypothetical protein